MRGTIGLVIAILVVTAGLAGLGYALTQMMMHADPDASLKAAAGLGTFAVSFLVMLILAR